MSTQTFGKEVLFMIIISVMAGWIGFRLGEIKQQNNTCFKVKIAELSNEKIRKNKLIVEALQRQGFNLPVEEVEEEKTLNDLNNKECVFVASRKSRKFHLADCKYGKKIKLENKVCFSSQEEAKKAGYQPAKGCLGSSGQQ